MKHGSGSITFWGWTAGTGQFWMKHLSQSAWELRLQQISLQQDSDPEHTAGYTLEWINTTNYAHWESMVRLKNCTDEHEEEIQNASNGDRIFSHRCCSAGSDSVGTLTKVGFAFTTIGKASVDWVGNCCRKWKCTFYDRVVCAIVCNMHRKAEKHMLFRWLPMQDVIRLSTV